MIKRDHVKEILEKKLRSELYNEDALLSLEYDFLEISSNNVEFHHFSLFLVGITTCLEVGIRRQIQDFIDSGDPYIDRVEKFKDFMKIDLNITRALYDKKVTFGEFVSHLLPLNNIENVISHLGVLLDQSFTKKLRSVWVSFEFVSFYETIGDVDKLILSLSEIFKKRHMIVHKGIFHDLSTEELEHYFETAFAFLHALSSLAAVELTTKRT